MRRRIWRVVAVLTWIGVAMAGPAAGAGSDGVVVIVNASNSVSDLSMAQLAGIYEGRKTTWDDGDAIVPVNRPTDSESRRLFYARVLRSEPTRKFFLPGSPIPLSTVVQSSAVGVKRFVGNAPGAVGYLLLSELGTDREGIKVLSIEGVRPSEQTISGGNYKLQ